MNPLKAFYLACALVVTTVCIAQDKPTLATKVYRVSQTFIDDVAGSSIYSSEAPVSDPFADPSPPFTRTEEKTPATVQANLTKAGITFGEGAGATYAPESSLLTVTNTADQLKFTEELLDVLRSEGEKQVLTYLEYIEVEHDVFSDWLFENLLDKDGTDLRNETQKWIRAGKGEIVESATVVAKSGQRAKVESVMEFIYPTEYDPAEVPEKVTVKDGAKSPATSATPTAFETRNLGITLEVDPVIGADGETIDLNLSPEIVELEAIEQWHRKMEDPRFKTHMPTFYTMRITTQITLKDGRYGFLGTTRPLKAAGPNRKNPIILQFVRCDVSSTKDWEVVK